MSSGLERELQLHAHALRGLARALVGDDHADDLLQDTAVAALCTAPPRQHGLGSWLAGIVRHLASRHHRRERRRRRREHLAARSEIVPAPTGTDDRDAFARLCAAVLALPEPYQSTILARYMRDQSPAAIAAHAGLPLETVRTRLKRGLQLLRERFAAERDDWRALLAAGFGLRPHAGVAAAAAAATGVLMMGTGVKLALGGVAAAVAVAAAWWFAAAPPPAVATERNGDLAAVPIARAAAEGDAGAVALPARKALEAAPTIASAPLQVELRGRVVDEDGAPIADVAVDVHAVTSSRTGAPPAPAASSTSTTAAGTFALAIACASGSRLRLNVRRDGFCPAGGEVAAANAGTLEVDDIVLSTAIRVRGRVVDEQGRPQSGVILSLYRDAGDERRRIRPALQSDAVSGADGRFEAHQPLPSGHGWIRPNGRSLLQGKSVNLVLDRQHPLLDVELVVRSAEPAGIAGIVVDERGLPVADAHVRCVTNDAQTSARADGHFDLQILAAAGDGPFPLEASAAGYESLTSSTPFARGSKDVRLCLRRLPELLVRVVAADTQQPVTDFCLMLLSGPPVFAKAQQLDMQHHPDGVARIAGAWRGQAAVWVSARDARLAPSTFVPVRIGDGEASEVRVALEPAAVRRLRVVDADRSPLAGVAIELIDAAGQPLLPCMHAFPPLQRRWGGGLYQAQLLQQGATDANGELELRGPAARPLALRLRGGGASLQVLDGISLAGDGPLVVIAERGATWTGRLVPAEIATALLDSCSRNGAGQQLGLLLWRDEQEFEHHPEPIPVERDGSFRIDGIASGTWQVMLCIGPSRWHAASIEARPGAVLRQDLDVSPVAPLRLEVQVYVEGKPYADGSIQVLSQHAMGVSGRRMGHGCLTYTDSEGRFAFDTFPGTFLCHLYLQRADGERDIVRTQPFTVATAGRARQVLEVRWASATLQVLRPDGTPAADLELFLGQDGFSSQSMLRSDQAGRAVIAREAAGQHLLRVRARSLATPAAQAEFAGQHGWQALQDAWIPLPPLQLAPGAAAEPIVVQLPPAWDR